MSGGEKKSRQSPCTRRVCLGCGEKKKKKTRHISSRDVPVIYSTRLTRFRTRLYCYQISPVLSGFWASHAVFKRPRPIALDGPHKQTAKYNVPTIYYCDKYVCGATKSMVYDDDTLYNIVVYTPLCAHNTRRGGWVCSEHETALRRFFSNANAAGTYAFWRKVGDEL